MTARTVACVILVTAIAGCGRFGAAVSGPLYTVTASVMQKPGERPHACAAIPLPYPPIGCGGPDVRGLDLATMAGVIRYRNGVHAIGVVRLVGTWDGQALVLTRAPVSAKPADATQLRACQQPFGFTGSSEMPAMMQRLMSDEQVLKSRGLLLLEFGPCDESSYFVIIPVADSKSVAWLNERYGPTLRVYGWLQPV